MCSSPEAVYRIELEGSRLNVCERCSSYGKMIGRLQPEQVEEIKSKKPRPNFFQEQKPEKKTSSVQLIVSDYPKLIKGAREKLGLKQEQLGKKIAEKESVIHKLESGSMKPGMDLARKLEKFLKISLVENVELDESGAVPSAGSGSSEGMTLRDMIKIKKK